MYKRRKVLAIIPARAGSKALPRKNIKNMCGKPLIAWAINEAKKSRYIDRVIVSTDGQAISGIARKFGAEIPFMRPAGLATDSAKMIDVILYTISRLKDEFCPRDLVVLLQPTSPLRLADDIDNAIEMFFLKRTSSVISVCEVDQHPYLMSRITADGRMKDFANPGFTKKNRQDLPLFYKANGAVYLASIGYLKKEKGLYGTRTYAYVMPKERSVDIDDELDFRFAELLLKERR